MLTLQRLNLDNSWYLEIGNLRLLIDPWLEGAEIDYFPWFNTQWHRTKPIKYHDLPSYDAVLITQKYPDHFHKITLARLQPKKVICPRSVKKRLEKLLPHAEVIGMGKKCRFIESEGVTIHFLPTPRKIDPIYDAFLLDDGEQSVFLAPHGFAPSAIPKSVISYASPCKLLIMPFNKYSLPPVLGGTVSPGMKNVKELCDVLNPKHVVATHDEDKHATGMVQKFARVARPDPHQLKQLSWLNERYLSITNFNPIHLR
jgi:L-ascorbate metabolism protein UlaG (beta-lactamase superfamily)